MAMTTCLECGHTLSTSAAACPQCGAKVPRTKWWLWVPLAMLVAFIGYGMSIPQYAHDALKMREACEALVGPFRKDECWRLYDKAMDQGRAAAGRPAGGYAAPVDQKLIAAAEKARADSDAKALEDCKRNGATKKVEYQRLMAAREYWSASLALRRCAELQDDAGLQALVADAEKKQYVMEIEAKDTTRDARNRAIEALLRDYPELGKRYASRLK